MFCLAPASDNHYGSIWESLASNCTLYSDDFALALMLYHAAHLQSLMLSNNYFGMDPAADNESGKSVDSTLFLRVLELVPAFTRPNGTKLLENLTTIILINPLKNHGIDFDPDYMPKTRHGRWSSFQVSQLLSLPTLKTFIATDMYEPNLIRTDWLLDRNPSNVTTVRLLRCNVSTESIGDLLHSCNALETFHWTITCPEQMYEPGLEIDCSEIYPEIQRLEPSLKYHGLYEECSCDYPCYQNHVFTIASLLSLKNLENLIIQNAGQDFGGEDIDLYWHFRRI